MKDTQNKPQDEPLYLLEDEMLGIRELYNLIENTSSFSTQKQWLIDLQQQAVDAWPIFAGWQDEVEQIISNLNPAVYEMSFSAK